MKKEITFIYSDSTEKAMYKIIAAEAEKRHYNIRYSNNPYEKCEIAFYCQHVNFPQYSKLSVIMLHDIIQQYSNWPDIWLLEPWNKYDIGILPSNQWVENWNKASHMFYARPRKGVFNVGWPKADIVVDIVKKSKDILSENNGILKNKATILYAPSWENDGKQNDFVEAMLSLDVNILIKQFDWCNQNYPAQAQNIEKLAKLHSTIPNVTILPPSTNIFEAIAVSDILVSDESSTMCEAVMMGIPAISVSDWLIPDVIPSRYPKCDYNFVVKTTKKDLANTVRDMLENYEYHQNKAKEFSKNNFSNVGKTSEIIMDIIDDCFFNKQFRHEPLKANKNQPMSLKQFAKHYYYQFVCTFAYNYNLRYSLVNRMWIAAQRVKKDFFK